jgi:stress response protein SCP2/uncharacterized protein involved in tellurium resistance
VTVTLAKGANLLLSDEAPGIEQVRIGLGWADAPGAAAIELDGLISVVGEATPGGGLLLANQVPNPEESVTAHAAEGPIVGDAEKLVVTLGAIPAGVSRLLFGMTIYDAAGRKQTFRSVRGAYVRVLDHANGNEMARYTLEPETGRETAMVFGELYRNPRGWKFRAVGQGYATGLRGVVGSGAAGGELPIVRPVEVDAYLRRVSIARNRRSLAEHLNPPHPVAAPKPPAPAASPPSAPRSPAAATPKPSQQPPSAPRPVAKAAPAPPARPASPPPKKAAPAVSSLDLSAPEPASAASAAPTGPAARPRAQTEFGEHSSRFRQRAEHVTALDDDHPATTWIEDDRGSGAMTLTLHWEALQTSTGMPRPSDLHFGCLWQAEDRSAGVMQTVSNSISAPGAGVHRQVLRLGRRDEHEGQTIFVDLAGLATFRRFFVFAYGQHGSPEWALLRPTLTVASASGEQLTIRLGDAPQSARLCVVASFHVVGSDLIIRRENDYLDGLAAQAAERYGWALEWKPDGMTLRD